ncbi:hypothetical protein BC940DRAFT_370851 [Gongronella butleri]|nr:hypothetical protein BC940DRAFT_370851 [Gongronella butleri]
MMANSYTSSSSLAFSMRAPLTRTHQEGIPSTHINVEFPSMDDWPHFRSPILIRCPAWTTAKWMERWMKANAVSSAGGDKHPVFPRTKALDSQTDKTDPCGQTFMLKWWSNHEAETKSYLFRHQRHSSRVAARCSSSDNSGAATTMHIGAQNAHVTYNACAYAANNHQTAVIPSLAAAAYVAHAASNRMAHIGPRARSARGTKTIGYCRKSYSNEANQVRVSAA